MRLRPRSKVKRGGMLLLDDSDRDRYVPLIDELGGWERRDFTGLKPGSGGPRHSTIFVRPGGASETEEVVPGPPAGTTS